jgi:septum site-determining protein MinD
MMNETGTHNQIVKEKNTDLEKNHSKGKIIGIVSLKGGVGKTTTVANLGASFASQFGKKVLIVDANFSVPNLALHFGLVDTPTTLHDVLHDKIDITKAIYKHEAGFHLVPSSHKSKYDKKKTPYLKLKQKINYLKSYYDYIIIDSSPNLNEEMLATINAADELYVVTSPDYPTLSTTLRAVKLAKHRKTQVCGLILNRVRSKEFELSINEIEDTAKVPVLGVLPEDVKVPESLYHTLPVTLHKPKCNASVEFNKLAASICGEEYNDPRILSRIIKFTSFFKK